MNTVNTNPELMTVIINIQMAFEKCTGAKLPFEKLERLNDEQLHEAQDAIIPIYNECVKGNKTVRLINEFPFERSTMSENTWNILSDIKNQITKLIEGANNNVDCKGWCIVFGNYSINIPPAEQEEFWEELEDIQQEHGVTFSVNDYNDLVLMTDQYEAEDF